MACAVMTTLPAGKIQTTLEFKVNIIRPIPAGVTVDAVGTVEHSGRSTGVAVGSLVDIKLEVICIFIYYMHNHDS